MSPMPALGRKTSGAFAILLCAVATPCLAQPLAPKTQAPPVPDASKPPPPALASPAPAPPPAAPPAAAASSASGPPAVPAPVAGASGPGTETQDKTTAATPDKPVAKPEEKAKPGPGANDAGHAATLLRTTKLSLVSLIDRSVIGKDKAVIGHVVDVLVDVKGQPAALVVDVGGILGMGDRRIAIAWERFALAGRKPKDALQLPLTDAQVKAAPAFDGSEQVTVVQGAIEPAPAEGDKTQGSKPQSIAPPPTAPAPAPAGRPPDRSRVDLGTGQADPPPDTAPPPDPLNPADSLKPD